MGSWLRAAPTDTDSCATLTTRPLACLAPSLCAPSYTGKPIDPTAPLQVDLLGGNCERLRARVPTLRSADLGVQFKA